MKIEDFHSSRLITERTVEDLGKTGTAPNFKEIILNSLKAFQFADVGSIMFKNLPNDNIEELCPVEP